MNSGFVPTDLQAATEALASIEPASVTENELCRIAGVPRRKLFYLLSRGLLPRVDIWLAPRMPRWRPTTVLAWLASQQTEVLKEAARA